MNTFQLHFHPRSLIFRGLKRFDSRIISVVLPIAVIVLSGCQSTQAAEQAPTTPPPEPTHTAFPTTTETTTPTKVPATDTPAPTQTPTSVPTATRTPRPPLGPEQPATSIEQVAGRWLLRIMGGGEGDPAILTLAEDGIHSFDAIGGYHAGMNVGLGTYWFDKDIMSLYSEHCTSPKTLFFECTGTYRVYVAMGEDGPGALRFMAIDDPHPDRKQSLNNKTLYPAPPAEE